MIFEKKTISIPSAKESVYKIEWFIEEICDRYNITNNYFGNISIAVMEAIDNAIIHGNDNNIEKKVRLGFELKPGEMIFEIDDDGGGFDVNKIGDPTDIEDEKTKDIGRGLFIIRSLADEVRFNEKGNKIVLIFKIKGISKEIDLERKQKLKGYKEDTKKVSRKS